MLTASVRKNPMTDPFGAAGMGQMLDRAMAVLNSIGADGSAAPRPEPVTIEGNGSGADGMVHVTAESPGHITGLVIEPRALRLGTEVLAEEISNAVNAALADLRSQAAATSVAPDLARLEEQLREVQANALHQFRAQNAALIEVQERIARQGGK
ncbi:YbaB/EbfC family nucleoid-associated protein [Micromonosporaceae bacterium DT55]|uniref:YbaB/EbfC family nucleoid-associated protein n=2 Tax=Melissospora conviva TaxID=3388432 RepID=UPI003C18A3F6